MAGCCEKMIGGGGDGSFVPVSWQGGPQLAGSFLGGFKLLICCADSRSKGAGIITLLPEVYDAVNDGVEPENQIPLIAAGGIMEQRGAGAAMVLGAAGVAMGTRFLASREATINRGYQRHIVDASDGGQNTVRTQLYNWLRGERNWPAGWDARGLVNESWRDHDKGVEFERNRELYAEAGKKGEEGWGERGRMATYAGTGVGLVREVKGAGEIVSEVRDGIRKVIRASNEL